MPSRLRAFLAAVAAATLLYTMPARLGADPASVPQPPASPTTPRPSEAPPPRIPAANFADSSNLSRPKLSPDGSLIVIHSTAAQDWSLYVLDSATRALRRKLHLPEKNDLEWYRWAGNGKLLVSVSGMQDIYGEDYKFTRLFMFDIATGQVNLIGSKTQGLDGDDLLFTDPEGRFVLLSMAASVFDYPAVWRFPLENGMTGKGVKVQDPKGSIFTWFADLDGVVRMGFESRGAGKLGIWYRKTRNDPLRLVGKLTEDSTEDDILDIIAITGGSDQGYVLKKDDSGHVALRRFDFSTRTAGETVFAAPGWDVDDYDYDERTGEPVAAYYTDDRDRVVWFDPELKKAQARIDRALKGSDAWIYSRSRDGSKMIVWAGHEDDPGVYFFYDAKKATMDQLFVSKPKLDPALLVSPKPISFTARDGTAIHGYLALPRGREAKKLPLVVLPHGGPYGIRDLLDYSTEVQFLANRGYAVLQPNYRGSGGYGEAFEGLGKGQIGRKMQDDIDDAMDWAVAQGIADPARVCVVGSSYGGYAALWAVIRNPERYRCAASFAGVTDWKAQLRYDNDFFTPKGARKWRDRVAGGDGASAFDLDLVSPAKQAGRLTRPVLLTHGDDDSNVPFKQFKAMRDAAAKAGKPIETVVFPGEGHGFDKPEDEIKWLETLEAFLARNNPADPPPVTPSGTPPTP